MCALSNKISSAWSYLQRQYIEFLHILDVHIMDPNLFITVVVWWYIIYRMHVIVPVYIDQNSFFIQVIDTDMFL